MPGITIFYIILYKEYIVEHFGEIFIVLIAFVILLFTLPSIIGMWKIYGKAGKPGWASIVPIYNAIVLLEITNKPLWWILLLCIPFVNIIPFVILTHRLALSFGKDAGYTVGLILLPVIFHPLLGFDKSVYTKLED